MTRNRPLASQLNIQKKVQLAIELHLFFVLSVQAFLAVLDYQALVVFVDYLPGKIVKE